jgi:hypothetical protein
LIVGFVHHGKMTLSDTLDGGGAGLVVIQSELTEAHTLGEGGDLKEEVRVV